MVAAELVDKNAQCAVLPVAMVNALARPEAMRPGLIEATADGSITKAKEIRDRVQEQRQAEERAKYMADLEAKRAAEDAKVSPQTRKRRAEQIAEQERQRPNVRHRHTLSLKHYATRSASKPCVKWQPRKWLPVFLDGIRKDRCRCLKETPAYERGGEVSTYEIFNKCET